MKNFTITLLLLAFGYSASAQTPEEEKPLPDFNRWSLEFSGGVNKATRAFAPGYFTNTPSFYTIEAGTRFNFTELFGLKLDASYNRFESDDDSLPFESTLYRASLQGVVNVGSIVGLRNYTDTFNFLVHGGTGVSVLTSDNPVDRDFSDGDYMLNFIVGITPQLKLSDRIVLTGDVSGVGSVRQDIGFDGLPGNNLRGFDGFYVTATAGITFYLGKAKKHADWYDADKERLDDLDDRLTKLETDLIDTDQDGVPDYLDREPNTISGVTVDTKGIAVDQNKNGVPDELEPTLAKYAKLTDIPQNTTTTVSGDEVIKKLIEDGYVNVYFKFNSTTPENYSLESINYLIKYMTENPSASAQLIGYADEIGNPTTNQKLSEKRAQKVKDIMIASGVSESRLSTTGNGEDTSVDKASAPARQLVRRVTFKLN